MAVQTFILPPDEDIPNNALPLVLCPQALGPDQREADVCQTLFAANGWGGNWVNGILDYWHYHTTGHEVLGCVAGSALVGFGGDAGVQVKVSSGDVVVIPAGVGHKRLSDKRGGFTIVGGYPPGQSGKIIRAGAVDVASAKAAISRLELPTTDPLGGAQGALWEAWRLPPA